MTEMQKNNREPAEPRGGRALRASDLGPLAGFLVPTVVIGFGYVIPHSKIAGLNDLTVGFAITVLSAAITYVVGVRRALQR